jgi:hypothetical protein
MENEERLPNGLRARAYAITGNNEECAKNSQLAREAAEQIKKKDDKDYFLSELMTIKC